MRWILQGFKLFFPFLTFFALYENNLAVQLTIWSPRKKIFVVIVRFYKMFDLRELKLMFLDPNDLIINNINKYLYSKEAIKFIFS